MHGVKAGGVGATPRPAGHEISAPSSQERLAPGQVFHHCDAISTSLPACHRCHGQPYFSETSLPWKTTDRLEAHITNLRDGWASGSS